MFKSNVPISNWQARRVWIIGASEGIGLALAHRLNTKKAEIIVSARNKSRLSAEFEDIAQILPIDVTDTLQIETSMELLVSRNMVPDTVFWLPALYHPTNLINLEPKSALDRLQTNILAAFNLFPRVIQHWYANPLEDKNYHWIWFSSLAAYRGLPNASDYGASRSAISHLAQSAHIELKKSNIDISLISPGFVDTRLTKKNNFKMPLIMTPDRVAQLTLEGLQKGRFETHFPKRMSWIFKLLNILPIGLYLKLMKMFN